MTSTFLKTGFCVLVLFSTGLAQANSTQSVTMKSISFDPKVVQISVGDSVEWSNKSYTDHSATFDAPKEFDTGLVKPKNTSQKFVFKQSGTFTYHCSVHGVTMSGQVIVKP